jgi:hypothetical protein
VLNGSGFIQTVNSLNKEKTMFTLDPAIDLIQTGKKNFVNTVFAQNKGIADALNSFVDAQTAYTKSAAKAGSDTYTKLTKESIKTVEDIAKYDYAKNFEVFTKSFQTK